MPEGRPLANMGVATNGSETAYSVLCASEQSERVSAVR